MNRLGISHAFLKKLLKGLGTLSILFSIVLVVFLVRQLDIINNPKALAYLIKNHLVIGSISFFALQIIQVVIPIIPGGVTTVVGFLAFGPVLGFFLNVTGICIGSSLLFKLVRKFLMIILICRPISIITFSYFWIYGGEVIRHFLMTS